MTATLNELKEYLTDKMPETDLLELLNITSEDLVIAFEEYIEANADRLIGELELDLSENADELEWWEKQNE